MFNYERRDCQLKGHLGQDGNDRTGLVIKRFVSAVVMADNLVGCTTEKDDAIRPDGLRNVLLEGPPALQFGTYGQR